MSSDESFERSAKDKGVTKKIVKESSGCSVKDIGEHDVHRILGSNGARTEHRKAELHGEDEMYYAAAVALGPSRDERSVAE
ncbi:hypothetical protein IGI04_002960 [Brassica rapa subsp. trilocularis]|uniref:Uncharacterized protein n=1 Tax=Brassica rapa subsp. trilocularis TaxID=1813537 RepID=A0ABQ7NX21_BRACM|nr:hypothetical protein IGI04_002960 [Brassica rapa subsp. trilocularis]